MPELIHQTKLIVLFRRGLDRSEAYNRFLMLLETLPGIRRKAVSTVFAGPGGMIPYQTVVEVYFDDREALLGALASPQGVEAGQELIASFGPDAVILYADSMEEDATLQNVTALDTE